MTIKTKLPLHYYQKYFSTKDSFELLLKKIEVLTDSRLIINSIRILIVMLALLLGFIHKSNQEESKSNVKKTEIIENRNSQVFENVN